MGLRAQQRQLENLTTFVHKLRQQALLSEAVLEDARAVVLLRTQRRGLLGRREWKHCGVLLKRRRDGSWCAPVAVVVSNLSRRRLSSSKSHIVFLSDAALGIFEASNYLYVDPREHLEAVHGFADSGASVSVHGCILEQDPAAMDLNNLMHSSHTVVLPANMDVRHEGDSSELDRVEAQDALDGGKARAVTLVHKGNNGEDMNEDEGKHGEGKRTDTDTGTGTGTGKAPAAAEAAKTLELRQLLAELEKLFAGTVVRSSDPLRSLPPLQAA